jgi:hypothetical protein
MILTHASAVRLGALLTGGTIQRGPYFMAEIVLCSNICSITGGTTRAVLQRAPDPEEVRMHYTCTTLARVPEEEERGSELWVQCLPLRQPDRMLDFLHSRP